MVVTDPVGCTCGSCFSVLPPAPCPVHAPRANYCPCCGHALHAYSAYRPPIWREPITVDTEILDMAAGAPEAS